MSVLLTIFSSPVQSSPAIVDGHFLMIVAFKESWLGLSQLCSVFDQLFYSIMLHYLINYASKCTNYASCQFYKVQFKIAV